MTARTVLIASSDFPPDPGPAARYVWHLARFMQSRHHSRVVIAAAAGRGMKPGLYEGPDKIPVYRLAAPGRVPPGPFRPHLRHSLRHIIDTEHVDLVNAHAPAPLFADAAARACGDVPFVLTYHSGRMRTNRMLPDRVRTAYERTMLGQTARRAREIVCSSDTAVADLPELFAGRSTTIYPGATMEGNRERSWEHQCDRTAEIFDRAADSSDRRVCTVAVVAPNYPPRCGGVEHYAERVAHAVAEDPAMRAAVITASTSGWRTAVGVEHNMPVVRLGTWARHLNTPVSPLWPLQVRRWLRRLGVDVINAHAPAPGLGDLVVALSGTHPTVLTYHAGSMLQGRPKVDVLVRAYEQHVLPRVFTHASALVASSPVSLAFDRPGAVQITPGVDVERFTPGPPPSTRPRTVVYVGRLDRASPWKGVDVLLHAFAALTADLPEARLRLVGGGDALPDHTALAERLGITDRVEFTGRVPGDSLLTAMREAAVLVLPSLTAAESFGMVLVEAMACGTPVIGSDAGGIPYVISDGTTGLLVPHNDPAALAAACRRVLRDGDLADRLGAAGRRCAVERYAWPALTDRYLHLFRSLNPRTHPTPLSP
ncbi:glycosyltransferase [Streptomyces sp. NPDC056470]|uniref:glycosyltransferase n=1 Tax=Streptomyces sp. NPDC056470 TaxID=3345831 RepID=UPI0036A6BC3C